VLLLLLYWAISLSKAYIALSKAYNIQRIKDLGALL